jgi:hypothetical protein
MKKMKLAFAALTFAVAGVANANVITASMSGVVNGGTDYLGLFGTTKSLIGHPATLTVSVEYDESDLTVNNPGIFYQAHTTKPFNVAVDLEGTTYTFSFADAADSTVTLSVSGGITFISRGRDAVGRQVTMQESMSQRLDAVSLTDYRYVPVRDNSVTRTAHFSVGTGDKSSTGFVLLRSDGVTLNGDPVTLPAPDPVPNPLPAPKPASVPEPASAMLFGVGLLSLATLRRHRRFR